MIGTQDYDQEHGDNNRKAVIRVTVFKSLSIVLYGAITVLEYILRKQE